jgi:stage IV sporulation protein FB
MAKPELRSTGGFWLVVGALLLAVSLRLLLWFALACIVHELGHALAVRALGGRVEKVRLTGVGAVLVPRRVRVFAYWEECVIALAGPLASFLLAAAAGAWTRLTGSRDACLLTGLSLALGIFNLLPAGGLDGGRIFRGILSWLAGPDTGERWSGRLTRVLGTALAGAGVCALAVGGNFTLLLCALWLLAAGRRGETFES